MTTRYLKRKTNKKECALLRMKYFFFFTIILLCIESIELKATEGDDVQNLGVKKIELNLNCGYGTYGNIRQWQPISEEEWLIHSFSLTQPLSDPINSLKCGSLVLKAYPEDKNFDSIFDGADWRVQTEWMVSGDTDVISIVNEDVESDFSGVPGTGKPDGTGQTIFSYEKNEIYFEEKAIIYPTGKTGTCTVSVKVTDKNGKGFTLPGKKITVKRWLDLDPDIEVFDAETGGVAHSFVRDDYITSSFEYEYTGRPIAPKPLVTDRGEILEEGKDYVLSFAEIEDIDKWVGYYAGYGNYPGPAPSVPFQITYDNNGIARQRTMFIIGCGDYSGCIPLYYLIRPNLSNQTQPEPETKLSCTKTYKKTLDSKPFKLSVKNAKGTVSYTSSNKKVATVNSKGVVTLKGTGLAKITVKASNGSIVSKVYVAPKKTSISKAKSTAKKTVTVTWKKDTKADGYEIQCNTNKNFKSGNKTVTVKKAKTTSAKVTKLKSGKKYYVRMRSYKTINGKKYGGLWSKVLTVKVK